MGQEYRLHYIWYLALSFSFFLACEKNVFADRRLHTKYKKVIFNKHMLKADLHLCLFSIYIIEQKKSFQNYINLQFSMFTTVLLNKSFKLELSFPNAVRLQPNLF